MQFFSRARFFLYSKLKKHNAYARAVLLFCSLKLITPSYAQELNAGSQAYSAQGAKIIEKLIHSDPSPDSSLALQKIIEEQGFYPLSPKESRIPIFRYFDAAFARGAFQSLILLKWGIGLTPEIQNKNIGQWIPIKDNDAAYFGISAEGLHYGLFFIDLKSAQNFPEGQLIFEKLKTLNPDQKTNSTQLKKQAVIRFFEKLNQFLSPILPLFPQAIADEACIFPKTNGLFDAESSGEKLEASLLDISNEAQTLALWECLGSEKSLAFQTYNEAQKRALSWLNRFEEPGQTPETGISLLETHERIRHAWLTLRGTFEKMRKQLSNSPLSKTLTSDTTLACEALTIQLFENLPFLENLEKSAELLIQKDQSYTSLLELIKSFRQKPEIKPVPNPSPTQMPIPTLPKNRSRPSTPKVVKVSHSKKEQKPGLSICSNLAYLIQVPPDFDPIHRSSTPLVLEAVEKLNNLRAQVEAAGKSSKNFAQMKLNYRQMSQAFENELFLADTETQWKATYRKLSNQILTETLGQSCE